MYMYIHTFTCVYIQCSSYMTPLQLGCTSCMGKCMAVVAPTKFSHSIVSSTTSALRFWLSKSQQMYVQVRMYMHIHVLYVDGWMDGVRNIGSAVEGTTHIL